MATASSEDHGGKKRVARTLVPISPAVLLLGVPLGCIPGLASAADTLKAKLRAQGQDVKLARQTSGKSPSYVFACSQHVACQAEWGLFVGKDGRFEERVRVADASWNGEHTAQLALYRNSSVPTVAHSAIVKQLAGRSSTEIRLSAQRREIPGLTPTKVLEGGPASDGGKAPIPSSRTLAGMKQSLRIGRLAVKSVSTNAELADWKLQHQPPRMFEDMVDNEAYVLLPGRSQVAETFPATCEVALAGAASTPLGVASASICGLRSGGSGGGSAAGGEALCSDFCSGSGSRSDLGPGSGSGAAFAMNIFGGSGYALGDGSGDGGGSPATFGRRSSIGSLSLGGGSLCHAPNSGAGGLCERELFAPRAVVFCKVMVSNLRAVLSAMDSNNN